MQLNEGRVERLALLSEKCGEVIQSVSRIWRHGYKSPHFIAKETNKNILEKELGDVLACAGLLALRGDISWTKVIEYSEEGDFSAMIPKPDVEVHREG